MSSINQALTATNTEFNQALSKQKGSALDKDSFMLLLVTQFKYQDPLNPMEDKEFIAQMAQFSSLEQLMNLNTSMEGLTTATNNGQMINATSYIGKRVSVGGDIIGKADGTVTSSFRYAPVDHVTAGQINVCDSDGNVVYSEKLPAKAANVTYTFEWNGKNNNGDAAPDGVYQVNIALLNAKGESVLCDQVVDDTVTGVVNDNGIVCLGLSGGQLMALANVRQVTNPPVKNEGDGDGSGTGGGSGDGGADGSGDTAGSGGAEGTEGSGGAESGEVARAA